MPDSTPDQPPRQAAPDESDLATRETVRIPTARGDQAHRETVRISPRVPEPRNGGTRGRRAPLPVAAAAATLWAAVLSYAPVALVMGLAQLAEGAGSIGGALHLGLAGWLLGHGVPLETAAGTLRLAPLALTALAGWRLVRAGVHVTRAIGARHRGSPGQALTVAGTVGIGYGVLGALATLLLGGGESASAVRAGLTFAAFGTLAALVGALRTTGALRVVARRMSPVLRDAIRTGVVGAVLVLAAGAGAAGLAVALHGGGASDVIGAYGTGVAGQAGITLVSLAYAPNVAVWAAAYLLGPGFALGTDTLVRTTEVSVGAVPAVPVFAGVPGGPIGGYGAALLAIPVVAGAVAGWLLTRRTMRTDRAARWPALLGAATLAGPVAGLVLGGAALVSSGPFGDGRLAQIGPVAWHVAVAGTVVVALGAMIGAAATRIFTTP
ncbi:DUF6350 family protein [Actinomycetes bacterium KLBMP 9797]